MEKENKMGFSHGFRLYLMVTPSPVSPSPRRGRGGYIERGAAPLLNTPLNGVVIVYPDGGAGRIKRV